MCKVCLDILQVVEKQPMQIFIERSKRSLKSMIEDLGDFRQQEEKLDCMCQELLVSVWFIFDW